MARVPRCALPDGSFHVGARGVAQMPIYLDDADRLVFLRLLVVAIARFDWTCHAFCLMTNHYHLVLDATREDLSEGLKILKGFYAQGFNGKYRRWGHVFGDRFWSRSLQRRTSSAPAPTSWRTRCARACADDRPTGGGALAAMSSARSPLLRGRTRRTPCSSRR